MPIACVPQIFDSRCWRRVRIDVSVLEEDLSSVACEEHHFLAPNDINRVVYNCEVS
jgi:hypothetical protein